MKRGFKTRCEQMALETRAILQLDPADRLCPFDYARHLGIFVLSLDDLDLADNHKRQLTKSDPDSWSGLTLSKGNSVIVVLNPTHSRPRQVSTLMHEISHILLKHVPTRVDVSETGMMLLSDYDEEQEEEADWLSATLLLPRDALLSHRRLNCTPEQIAKVYAVSIDLCSWRLKMTGVDTQLRASRHR